jgi:hypothetical protein
VAILHCTTAEAAIDALKTNSRFDCVWLDHDLEDTDPDHTGMVVAEFIANHIDPKLAPRRIVVHSWNQPAAVEMTRILNEAGIPTRRVPFSSTAPAQRK